MRLEDVIPFVEAERKRRSLRKGDLADRAHMTASVYSRFLTGERQASYEACCLLLEALGYACTILVTDAKTGKAVRL